MPLRPCLLACLLPFLPLAAGEVPVASCAPVVLWDLPLITAIRVRTRQGDAALQPALDRLRADADKAAQGPLVAVTDKGADAPSPSGDPHDYVSFAGYFWPDPKDGKAPWMMKDGVVNHAMIRRYDQPRLKTMITRVTDGSLAWWFTGEPRHAEVAVAQLRRWFIAPETRMNPHMDYGQCVPNRKDGKGNEWGIIDANGFTTMLSAIALLEVDGVLPLADRTALRAWFSAYLRWLTTSELGRRESRAANNHGAFYDQLVIACALYAGDTAQARAVLERYGPLRIAGHIQPDGSTPEEQKRAFAAMYTTWNLIGMAQTMAMGRHCGVDLWSWSSTDGRSLRVAAGWLTPYMEGRRWDHGRNDRFSPAFGAEFFWILASVTGEAAYRDLARRHGGDPAARHHLLVPLPGTGP